MTITSPSYDRALLRPRILHIGFGAFARAHQLVYLDEVLDQTDGDWGVVAARLNSGAAELSELDAADGLYHVVAQDGSGTDTRAVGCVIGTAHPARDGSEALPDLIASAPLSIISLTITEKGYGLTDGAFDPALPANAADIANPDAPRSAVGVILRGLARRRAAGLGGVTVLSCDNLPHNGALCRAAVLGMAKRIDPDLAAWVAQECRFPATMVDRIVPALTNDSRALIAQCAGRDDPNGILCEPFRQWVIEDSFAAGRPAFEKAGALMVSDVAPYEDMKLRMLNGPHSFIAYLGALSGYETVADCMDDPTLRAATRALMLTEQAASIAAPAGVDLTGYADDLIERFSNPALRHKTVQIAMDGSQKLPQRLLAGASVLAKRGAEWPLITAGVAGWMGFVRKAVLNPDFAPLQDPLADQIRAAASLPDGPEFVAAMVALPGVFPADTSLRATLASPIARTYADLVEKGPQGLLKPLLGAT
ncbi:D-mannonate oxidoreductase [Actibacterium mucosum KCTC 23349]|uniref:D-mannonate oxidoreductase n=1 Tax=Actibacterium mucosum KCTC 23349 TaxID=1454373 RepID=A0A037ZHS8_9RHOB|nr:mannitol dehydrogenase family protein [Actibacterium mucosum]KAJ55985.1 D-mannonate oxidoreductase [Actibacterium mucosum KCTC 23349]